MVPKVSRRCPEGTPAAPRRAPPSPSHDIWGCVLGILRGSKAWLRNLRRDDLRDAAGTTSGTLECPLARKIQALGESGAGAAPPRGGVATALFLRSTPTNPGCAHVSARGPSRGDAPMKAQSSRRGLLAETDGISLENRRSGGSTPVPGELHAVLLRHARPLPQPAQRVLARSGDPASPRPRARQLEDVGFQPKDGNETIRTIAVY